MKTNNRSTLSGTDVTSHKNVRGKKTRNPGYKPGDHWVQCDICASSVRSSDARLTWDNMVVCPDDWEPRHPQDFVRGRSDNMAAQGLVRTESEDVFVGSRCTSNTAIPGKAIPGCMVASVVYGFALKADLTPIPPPTFGPLL
jgi:hypothetical protein